MLCSLLPTLCTRSGSSSKLAIRTQPAIRARHSSWLLSPQQQQPLPSLFPLTVSMSSSSSRDPYCSSLPASPSSTMSRPVSSPVTPPGSPPSPTMSMGSINDQSQRLDMALQLSMRKIRVMIVDDNCINLAILSRMLTVHFAESVQLTAVMTSGVAALQALGKEEVDLILMDIDMPVLTGVETVAAIRENRPEYPILAQNQKVPIIAVTTSDGCAQRQLYLQVGMSDCVSKPIALPRLRKAINSAMWPCGRWSC